MADSINTAFKVSLDDFDDVMSAFNLLSVDNFGSILGAYQDQITWEGTVTVSSSPTHYNKWSVASKVKSPTHAAESVAPSSMPSPVSSPVTVRELYESVRVRVVPAPAAPVPPPAYDVLDRSGVSWYIHGPSGLPNFNLRHSRVTNRYSRNFIVIDDKVLAGCLKLTGDADALFKGICRLADGHYKPTRTDVSREVVPISALLFKR